MSEDAVYAFQKGNDADVTHYKTPAKLPGVRWDVEAEVDFLSPALCGAREWTSATDQREKTTCPRCVQLLAAQP